MSGAVGLAFAPGMTGTAKVVRILSAVLIVAVLLALSYCQGRSDGKAHVELANQKAITEAVKQDRESAERRQKEEIAAARKRGEEKAAYDQAIASAPGGANSPAAHALACERLRRSYGAGHPDIPPSCGH